MSHVTGTARHSPTTTNEMRRLVQSPIAPATIAPSGDRLNDRKYSDIARPRNSSFTLVWTRVLPRASVEAVVAPRATIAANENARFPTAPIAAMISPVPTAAQK